MIAGMYNSILRIVIVASFFCCVSQASAGENFSRCLPADVKLDSAVALPESKTAKAGSEMKTTVKTRLSQLKARCRSHKLVSSAGKEIRFITLLGCWGNPPENYQEMFTEQAKEIERLKKKYILIQIPCGGNADPRLIN
jgi:hypothetical protein